MRGSISVLMRLCFFSILVLAVQVSRGIATEFGSALDLIVRHHADDTVGLRWTLDTLIQIVTRLKHNPEERKYRSIRLLNKNFWERVGKVNGGLSFMTALGFDLVERQDRGPSFEVRPGVPDDSDLDLAMELLRAQVASKDFAEHSFHARTGARESTVVKPGLDMGFDPYSTAFSRKSRTHIQERAEEDLASLTERKARLQYYFETVDERHVTIMLPATTSPAMTDGVDANSAGAGGGADPRELELIARLWRERHAREDFERFETVATRKLRVLRASKTYPYMLLRVRLPDGLHMQARFNLDESMEVVRESLQAEAIAADLNPGHFSSFELFFAPPTRVLPCDSTSLKDLHVIAPACVLHLRWNNECMGATNRGRELEQAMARPNIKTRHERVPFSSRYDVPVPFASSRAQQGPRQSKGRERINADPPS